MLARLIGADIKLMVNAADELWQVRIDPLSFGSTPRFSVVLHSPEKPTTMAWTQRLPPVG